MERVRLKICHVITRMIVGGAQENTLLTIMAHLEAGHEVVLLTGPSPGPEGELLRQGEWPDFEVLVEPLLVRELDPVGDFRAYLALRRFFRARRFDVVHTHSSKAGVIGRAAARAAAVPLVVHTVHGQAFHRYEKGWRNWLFKMAEKFAARRCERIFAVCQAMVDQCVEAGVAPPEKYRVVYSGMRLEHFLAAAPKDTLRSELGIPPGVPVLGCVARLFPLKGYEYFIPVAKRLAAEFADAHFLIVGDGPRRPEIEADVGAAGLAGRFHFAGLVPPSAIPDYLALMTVLAHFSLREGLPRAVPQAMAAGKPAVGFNLDGTPEVIIEGETGHLLEPGDIDGAVAAVADIFRNPDAAREMGANGRRMVAEMFDWRRMGEILEEEYYRCLAAK